MKPVLEVRDLELGYRPSGTGPACRVVGPLSFSVAEGEALGLLGESGAGKSTVALEILGLLTFRSGQRLGGEIRLNVPRERVALIPQDPLSAMDPLCPLGVLFRAVGLGKEEALSAMERVRLPLDRVGLKSYPHELSGGMRQRVLIALAVARKASLIVADEPTSSLDVTVQAEILQLFQELKGQGISFVMVTHNVPVAKAFADRVAVMRKGLIVESGPTAEVFAHPSHDYTRSLLRAVPALRRSGIA
ncbi:MAG: ABC transporter ATP-binding protein [Candidatus Omnitrophica bacterium]|nr:ABC transporter ATP-binding protein [Candidatus Omnitrophota bacterium]